MNEFLFVCKAIYTLVLQVCDDNSKPTGKTGVHTPIHLTKQKQSRHDLFHVRVHICPTDRNIYIHTYSKYISNCWCSPAPRVCATEHQCVGVGGYHPSRCRVKPLGGEYDTVYMRPSGGGISIGRRCVVFFIFCCVCKCLWNNWLLEQHDELCCILFVFTKYWFCFAAPN